MYKQAHINAFIPALKKWDLVAVVYIPLFAYGNSFYQMKGYRIGAEHGNVYCWQCRHRLKRKW